MRNTLVLCLVIVLLGNPIGLVLEWVPVALI
jgi:hypothetical protein